MDGGGICRKRVGNEEIFGSSSSPTACWQTSSNKRSKFGYPEFGSGSEDKVWFLTQMFPGFSHELLESVLKAHDDNVEAAVGKLHSISSENVQIGDDFQRLDNDNHHSCAEGPSEHTQDYVSLESPVENTVDTSKWSDEFVREMMSAISIDDARERASRLLGIYEKNIISLSRVSEELEHATLKEHLQKLLKDNQILKRAIGIQNERSLEQEEKARQVQQLKNLISQYQAQIQSLELNNYTLQFHLQRAQESNNIPGQFHGRMP